MYIYTQFRFTNMHMLNFVVDPAAAIISVPGGPSGVGFSQHARESFEFWLTSPNPASKTSLARYLRTLIKWCL